MLQHPSMSGKAEIYPIYLNMDTSERMTKKALLEEFPDPCDYYIREELYCIETDTHCIIWAYSHTYFERFELYQLIHNIKQHLKERHENK